MKVGTKSILFGSHAFWIHPWLVAWAWWKLYSFPWKPWLWIMFFVHDLGYWGKPNMDGSEGEEHPWLGAHILYWCERVWQLLNQPVFYRRPMSLHPKGDVRWWQLRRRWGQAYMLIDRDFQGGAWLWGNVSLYHSRFLAKRYGTRPSELCFADKFLITLEPWWLYLPRAIAAKEIREYVKLASDRRPDFKSGLRRTEFQIAEAKTIWVRWPLYKKWYKELQAYMREWVAEHLDGREDTWTPEGSGGSHSYKPEK